MYTKGEWKAEPVEGKRLTCVHTEKENIALLVEQANAQLISAAPDLLNACEEALSELRKQGALSMFGTSKELVNNLKKAINKAKGTPNNA